MASIDLVIAGRRHELACRDGEEAHLRRVAAMVDVKATDAAHAMGGMREARQMLFTALMLADELNDARATLANLAAAPPPAPEPDLAAAALIESLAMRVERLSAMIDAATVAPGLESPVASA